MDIVFRERQRRERRKFWDRTYENVQNHLFVYHATESYIFKKCENWKVAKCTGSRKGHYLRDLGQKKKKKKKQSAEGTSEEKICVLGT